MKIRCDVCERAEAALLCCADEAALCWECDQKVHAANKLAQKHQRVPLLTTSSQIPKCDICQEKAGYFFCLEDRALLCRQCDVSIHTASPYVIAHQRFLVTGVKVALHQHTPNNSTNIPSSPGSNVSLVEPPEKKCRTGVVAAVAAVSHSTEQVPGFRPHWPLDEILATGEFDCAYGYSELGSSRITSQ